MPRRSRHRHSPAGAPSSHPRGAGDGNGLIVRLYEAAGASTRAVLHCGFALAAAEATDLIEENPVPVEIAGRELRLDLRPFDILTLRLLPAA